MKIKKNSLVGLMIIGALLFRGLHASEKSTIKREHELTKKELELAKKEIELLKKELAFVKKEAEPVQKEKPEEKEKPPEKKSEEKKKEKEKPEEKKEDEIVIGTTLGLTGNIKKESENIKKGLLTRIEKENEAGGINGKKIRLVVLDDGYEPERALENVQTLIDKHKVDVLLSPAGSSTTKKYMHLAAEKEGKVLILFPHTGSPDLRSPTPKYMLHFRPSYPAMYTALNLYAKKNGAKRFAFVIQRDSVQTGIDESIKNASIKKENYIKVFHKRNVTDMAQLANEVKNFKVDAIVSWTTSGATMSFIKALGTENLKDTSILGTELGDQKFHASLEEKGLTEQYVDAQSIPNPWTSELPILKEYRNQVEKEEIDALAATAYINADIFIQMLKKTDGNTDKDKLLSAAQEFKDYDLGGITLTFDKEDKTQTLSPFIWLNTGKKDWVKIDTKPKKEKPDQAAKKKTEEAEEKPKTS